MPDEKRTIAIDIDDVVANMMAYAQDWAGGKSGITLDADDYYTDDEYWHFYDSIWRRHKLPDDVSYENFHNKLAVHHLDMGLIEDAGDSIRALNQRFNVIFITSRAPVLYDQTRKWLDKNIDPSIPVYLSAHKLLNSQAMSKGELCVDLGASLLIDDNIDNCQSALDNGVEAILFGRYGWNQHAPEGLTRCTTWKDILEYLDGR